MLDVNWNAVFSFWLVAKHGSFAEAARALPRGSIQALHKRVRQLETEQNLNLKLLRSQGVKGVALTEAGRGLYELLDPVFGSFEVLVAELRGEDTGLLSVAMTGYAAYNYADDLLPAFHAAFPKVSLQFLIRETAEVISLLEKGHVHVGICSPPTGASHVDIRARAPIHFEILAPRHHRLRHKAITWEEVVLEPLILHTRGSKIRQAIEDLLSERNLISKVCIAAEVTTPELALAAVRAGLGIAIAAVGPRLSGRLRGVARIAPPPGLQDIDIVVLCRRDQYLPRYMRSFIELAASLIVG